MAQIDELFFTALVFLLTKFFLKRIISTSWSSRRLPPGPRGWPVLGCLPILGAMPHVALAELAQKYGAIMYLKLGTCDVVVASKPDSARAFLKTLDLNFSNRPPNAGATHIAYGAQDFVFADVGPRWNLLRKLTSLHMLGAKSFKDWGAIRGAEIRHMVRAMCESSRRGEPVAVPEMLSCALANIIGQKSLSRRVFETLGSESNDFKEMVVELMRLAGLFNVGDFIPSIAWMDLQGIELKMKLLHDKFDALLTKMIEEHSATAHERLENPDILDIVMAEQEQEHSGGAKLSMVNIKALLLNLFIAGTDTSSGTIEWALAEILKNPAIFKRAQAEMDQVIGKNRLLRESDIPNLPYLEAICKETFRKHPAVPLNIPRVSADACKVDGYYIPADTRLFVNVWAIGRDPEVWENPLEFRPERFLSEQSARTSPWGNDFELLPFGAGRRTCAGIRMGIEVVTHALGTLVHSFDWKLCGGDELNMDEAFGLVLQKAVPLSAMVTPRLHPSAYEAMGLGPGGKPKALT